MKKTYLITTMILMALMSTVSYGVTPAGPLSVNGNRIVDQNDVPVSFAGVSFFWTNYGWGGEKYYNADCLNWLVSDWKVEIVRAAMGVEDWDGYIYRREYNQDKLTTIVDASIAAGIYVIIDWHSHQAEDYEDEAIEFFEEMATTYGGYDNVIYEIYNEPENSDWEDDIKPYAEAVIAAIRAIDPDNLIVVGSPEWSQRVDKPAGDPITGYINIAYTLHFYPDMGHTGWLRSRATSAMNDGIALMVTEWGPKGYLVHDENTAWMDWCELNYVSHTAWAVNDKDEPWSFLDKWIGMSSGGWTEEDLSTRGQVVKDICLNWDDTPDPPLTPGIVGRWKLNENQRNIAADATVEGNDGTLGGSPQWVTGKFGSALAFDGDDYVDLGNPPVLDFGTNDFTLCCWVKNPGGNNAIAKGGDQSGGVRYALQVGSTVQLLVDDNSDKESVSGGAGLQDGQWHHVAGVRDGGTLRVFIDSVEVASGSLPYTPYSLSGTSQHNAYIAAVWQHEDGALGDFYTGSIDDARIYVGALTSTELADVMLNESGIGSVDFNSDGNVNFEDFCYLAAYFGDNEPSTDFGPLPFADEKVDVGDVAAFIEHWLTDVLALAHWRLDEAEGDVAYDAAGDKDGVLHGDPNWLTTEGSVGGAIEFDGIGDYVSTDYILDPAAGPFSVYAWVKGGGPGQTVISQTNGTGTGWTWLSADSAGNLMTDLRPRTGRGFGPLLVSDFPITDGDWRRIGLVWDGTYRYLYVDGAEVTEDSEPQLLLSEATGGLYFGAANTLSPGTHWLGLIDDIRIYDTVVVLP